MRGDIRELVEIYMAATLQSEGEEVADILWACLLHWICLHSRGTIGEVTE
jgi:hypothetical protein